MMIWPGKTPSVAALLSVFAVLAVSTFALAADAVWPIINQGDWISSSEDDRLKVFVRPAKSTGLPRAWMRMEYREPMKDADVRSVVFLQEFDCEQDRVRALEFRSYRGNNMAEIQQTITTPDQWQSAVPGTVQARVVTAICEAAAAKTAPPAAAPAAPVAQAAPKSPASVWPAMVVGQWLEFGEIEDIKVWYAIETRTTWVRSWMRFEFLQPQDGVSGPFRSARELIEYDCKGGRSRSVMEIRYPQPNLAGAPDMEGATKPWTRIERDSLMAQVAKLLCDSQAEWEAEQVASGEMDRALNALIAELEAPYRNMRIGDWHALVPIEGGRMFIRGAKGEAYPQIEARWEYLTPTALAGASVMSTWHRLELNCETSQFRFVESIAYPQSNLKGKGVRIARDVGWRPMEEEYSDLGILCDRLLDAEGAGTLAALGGYRAG